METPETRYARSGELSIAYQVVGDGPIDLVAVPGWVSHLEWSWREPGFARMLEKIGSFSRLIFFDKRGTGLSDHVARDALPTMEERMDDLRAVMDAAGSESAAIFGISEGGPLALLFAASHPERVSALALYGSYARWVRSEDYPWAPTREQHERSMASMHEAWGRPLGLDRFAPSRVDDPQFNEWWATYQRLGASPGDALALYRMNIEIDIRHVLPTVRVPTLILHRADDRLIRIDGARYMAAQIPGASLVQLEGGDHLAWSGDVDAIVGEVQEFLTGVRDRPEPQRLLATVLFADVVGSTERAAELGDRRWRDVQERFLGAAARSIGRFQGLLLDTAGDGFLASFDGPARAVRCACAVRAAASDLGLELRSGLHTGECEVLGDKLSGIAVHLGARVSATAAPGEVLASSTVRDLVAGSGLEFQERGSHELKGIPGEWRLYAVVGGW